MDTIRVSMTREFGEFGDEVVDDDESCVTFCVLLLLLLF